MVRFKSGLLLGTTVSLAASTHLPIRSPSVQQTTLDTSISPSSGPRKLQGRFLHITDIHPDSFYKIKTDPDGEHPCHAGSGRAGYYGAEITECDSPFSLVNATFQWIDENLKDQIDFVIWTGDSARHDNDEDHPRTDQGVKGLNKYVVNKFVEVFGKKDRNEGSNPTNDFIIPIVPTFGNNDILPHNIFSPGPNKWTKSYLQIWQRFVPQEQRHSFARGGWFFSEVIPNRLAVFSLNTLYFFESNSAVDGCDSKSEPGYEHMEWLRTQLQFLRQRGMKALLIGHVPPARTESKQSWDESCYQKYTLWMRQYRDVVIGSIYGHMNIDHFMFQDVKDLRYKFAIDDVHNEWLRGPDFVKTSTNDTLNVAAKATYLNELRDGWSSLPTPPGGSSYLNMSHDDLTNELNDIDLRRKNIKKSKKAKKKFLKRIGGPYGERYSISIVSPSVVPNFYPTLRIMEYNITGLEKDHPAEIPTGKPGIDQTDLENFNDDYVQQNDQDKDLVRREDDLDSVAKENETYDGESSHKKKKKKKKKNRKSRKPPFPLPKPPSKTESPGPAYSPQTLTLLSWTQYFANLTKINQNVKDSGIEETAKSSYKHFKYQVEYSTKNDKFYDMPDLTMKSWLNMAEKISRKALPRLSSENSNSHGLHNNEDCEDDSNMHSTDEDLVRKKKVKNHLWRTFIKRAFVHTKREEELDEQFGW